MKRSNIFLMLVFIACSCWINGAFAQVEVTFPDDNLEAAVKKALRIADTEPILETDLETLERLTVTNKGIINLTGLDRATGLRDLDLGNNVIVNLGPLSNLTSLEELDLADNQIVGCISAAEFDESNGFGFGRQSDCECVMAFRFE